MVSSLDTGWSGMEMVTTLGWKEESIDNIALRHVKKDGKIETKKFLRSLKTRNEVAKGHVASFDDRTEKVRGMYGLQTARDVS